MTNHSLLQLFASLSRKEATRFCEFARSPYFNKHKDVRALASYLSEIYPRFITKKCDRAVIYQKLFPGKPYSQQELAVIFTYTLRLLEQFLRVELSKEEGLLEDSGLLFRQLRKKNQLLQLEKKLLKTAESKPLRTATADRSAREGVKPVNFETQIRLAAEKDALATQLSRHEQNHLADKQRWLDAFYLSEKLRDACELHQRSKLLNLHFTDPLLEKVLSELEENHHRYVDLPPVAVYFYLYKMLKSNDLKLFNQTLEAVRTQESALPKGDLQNIYNYMQNFCIEQINKGNQAFLEKLFGIYRSQLDMELIFLDSYLPEWHFKNIVTTGLRLGEHEWVRQFLERYRHRLHPEAAENAYRYNLAAWHHQLGRYDEALRLLLQVEFTDLRYNLDAKSMLLRTYFDLEEEEALIALTEAFQQFLKRNRTLSDFQKRGYFNLLKFSRRAFRLKMSKGFLKEEKWQAEVEKLERDMTAAETIFNQSWLEGKVKSLCSG